MKQKGKRTLTPRLRFPEFRDSEGWQTPQLSDLYAFKRTNTLSRDKLNYESGTIRNIHYGDIHTKFKPLFRVDREYVPFINAEIAIDAFQEEDDCEEGDIVFADASEDLSDIGKAIEVVSLDGQRVVAGTHTILATRHGSIPIVGFGGHLFQSAAVRAEIQRESQGAKVYGISAKRISPVTLPLPPTIKEQQKIAECLGSLDLLIAAEGRKLPALLDHKRGLMQQLFPEPGQTQPRLRFLKFQNTRTEFRPIGTFAKVTTGNKDTQNKVDDGEYPFFVRSQNVERINSFSHDCEAVLTSGDGVGVGENYHYIDGKFDFHQRVYCIYDFTQSVSGRFFFYYFSTHFKKRVKEMSAKNSVDSVRMAMITEMPIWIPPPAEQCRIADCLTALEIQITAQSEKIDALKQHKRGLMQQLFPPAETI